MQGIEGASDVKVKNPPPHLPATPEELDLIDEIDPDLFLDRDAHLRPDLTTMKNKSVVSSAYT